MKSKGQNNYSKVELKRMKMAVRYNKSLPKPLSTIKLATVLAKDLGRSRTGVYYKMLGMTTKRTKTQRVTNSAQPNVQPVMGNKKSITFSKPTKIEISDNGMTFYF